MKAAEKRALFAVLAAVALVGAPALTYPYVSYDDPIYVLENPLVIRAGEVSFLDHLTTPNLGYPMPATVLTYRVEYALVGHQSALLPHALNLVLHLFSVALTFLLARRVGLGTASAALAALVFGLHPLCAEPVTWITGRKDVLALPLVLAACHLGLGGASSSRRASVFASLGLGAKPTAVVAAPLRALLLVRGLGARAPMPPRDALRAVIPESVLGLALVPFAYLLHARYGGLRAEEDLGTTLRSVVHTAGIHLHILVGLEPPSIDHTPDHFPAPFEASVDLVPLAFVLSVLAVARAMPHRRSRDFVTLILAACLAYLPNAGFVPLNRYAADSYLYPPLPFLAVALAVLADATILGPHASARLPGVLVSLVGVTLAALYVPSAGRFRSARDLFAEVVEHHPDRWAPCKDWSSAVREAEGPAQALRAIDRCIERFGPGHFEKNRALALFELGRVDEAAVWMARALAHDPAAADAPSELLERARAVAPPVSPSADRPAPAAP